MVASIHGQKKSSIKDLVPFLLHDCMVSVALVDGGCFLQLMYDLNRRKNESHFVSTTTSTDFEYIFFFHFPSVLNDGLLEKTLTAPQGYRKDTLIGFCAQHFFRT